MRTRAFFAILLMAVLSLASCKKDSDKPAEPVTTYPDLVLNGITYTLSPKNITVNMIHGQGDKYFTVLLIPSDLVEYGFSVYGYGEGFPDYGIMSDVSSGGAGGTVTIKIRINESALSPNTVYKGYLPIHVYLGSETGADHNFLKLALNVTVK